VQQGVSYLGICAGAFLAGDGRGYYNSLDLTSGVRFGFYAAENRGIRRASVALALVDALPIEHYWEDVAVDILQRNGDGFHLTEVKSSS